MNREAIIVIALVFSAAWIWTVYEYKNAPTKKD